MSQIILGGEPQSAPLNSGTTVYGGIYGRTFFDVTDDTYYREICPCAGTIKNLYVKLTGAPGAGKSYTFTLCVNGTPSALTCTIADTDTTGSDVTNTVSVSAGGTLSLVVVPSGSPTSVCLTFATQFTPSVSGETFLSLCKPTNYTTTLEFFSFAAGSYVGDNDTNATSLVIPCAGTVKKLYTKIVTAPSAPGGKTWVFTVQKNNVASALTCTIANNETTANDTTHSFTVVAGDRIDIDVVPANTPAAWGAMTAGIVFLPDTAGNFILPHTKINDTPDSNRYFPPIGDKASNATESNTAFMVPGNLVVKEMWLRIWGGAMTGSDTETITLRKGGVNTALTCTLDSTNPLTNNSASTITFSDYDLVSQIYAISGSGKACQVSLLGYLSDAIGFLEFLFKDKNTSQQDTSVTWKGKTNLDPAIKPVYLEIFNRTSGLWEVLDSDNSSPINTNFTLTAIVSADLGDYFDANNWISCRVYQELN